MESKRFIIIEDIPAWQEEIKDALVAGGHIVVERAATLEAALALVPKFKEMKVDAITLDGNLCDDLAPGRDMNDDAKDIITAIQKHRVRGVRIIGMSMNTLPNVDINIHKPVDTKKKLDQAIETLFNKEK